MRSAAIFPLMLLVGSACGNAPPPSQPQPTQIPTAPAPSVTAADPAPAPSASASSATQGTSTCLAPWSGTGDRKIDPKPIDPKKAQEIESLHLSPAEKAYERARLAFEAQRWDEAGRGFREVAEQFPDQDLGIYAVQLYLESLNVLGSRGGRPECYEEIATALPHFIQMYCGARRSQNEEQCGTLDRIAADLARLRAQRATEEAEQAGDMTKLHAAADQYMDLAKAHCVGPSTMEKCDEVLYNAAVDYLRAGDHTSAEKARAMMADPKNGMQKSALLPKLTCVIARGISGGCQ